MRYAFGLFDTANPSQLTRDLPITQSPHRATNAVKPATFHRPHALLLLGGAGASAVAQLSRGKQGRLGLLGLEALSLSTLWVFVVNGRRETDQKHFLIWLRRNVPVNSLGSLSS